MQLEPTNAQRTPRSRNRMGDANSKYAPPDSFEFFIEPDWCVHELFCHQNFIGDIWDPACGSGTILRVASEHGYITHGSDIVNRGPQVESVADFLKLRRLDQSPFNPVNVVTNSPYSLAEKFVVHALSMPAVHQTWLLVNQKFLWSRERRDRLFSVRPPARILILSDRPSMPPGDAFLRGEIKRGGGMKDFCWVGWSTTHRGPTLTDWMIHTQKPKRGVRNGSKKEEAPAGSL